MLPVSVSLRRAAIRVARRAPSAAIAAHANGGVMRLPLPASYRLPAVATVQRAQWFSTTAEELAAVDEITEVVLEPLGGFADQKELSSFELSATSLTNLHKAGITHLFPVQAQSFAVMMKGSDIVGRSKTGSGKTLAFGLPIVERLLTEQRPGRDPRALILLPTRELAQQVADAIKTIAPQLRIVNVVGGVSYTLQENQLRRGVDILVGTPGRITDLVDKQSLSLEHVQVSVLDEADMMLKFGFQEAVEQILSWVPADGQRVLWSATFPKWVSTMAKKFTKDAVNIDLVGDQETHVPATVSHKAIHAPSRSRLKVLESVLRHHARGGQTLIFTETKQEADEIANALPGLDARALHGDLSQGMRTSTMDGFRSGQLKTLVCTDIAARGLDIANVDLVVQYRLPSDKESFVHRAGRTGRAGRSGTNIVFFDRNDVGDVRDFERRFKFNFAHASPPHVDQVLAAAVNEMEGKLQEVPVEASSVFAAAAQRLLDQQGVGALSAALALLGGFDKQRLSAFSMLTGRSNMQTVEVGGVLHARQLQEALEGFSGQFSRHDLHVVDGKFVLDIPHDAVERLRVHLATAVGEDATVAPVLELSKVLLPGGSDRVSDRSFGGRNNNSRDNNRGGGRRNGGGGGGNFFGSFSRGRDRDFDSGFKSGGGRDRDYEGGFKSGGGSRDRSPRRGGSSFGRFSEDGFDKKPSGNSRGRNSSSGGFRDSW